MDNSQVEAALRADYKSALESVDGAERVAARAKTRLGAFLRYTSESHRLNDDAKSGDKAAFVGLEDFWSQWTEQPAPAPKA